jgi:hypothetical protein
VTDIVPNNIPHEKRREINTHNGQHQIKPVERCDIETGGEQKLYLGDNPMKNITSYGSKHSHHKTEQECKVAVTDVPLAPFYDVLHCRHITFL